MHCVAYTALKLCRKLKLWSILYCEQASLACGFLILDPTVCQTKLGCQHLCPTPLGWMVPMHCVAYPALKLCRKLKLWSILYREQTSLPCRVLILDPTVCQTKLGCQHLCPTPLWVDGAHALCGIPSPQVMQET
jgi:hypothetical protein